TIRRLLIANRGEIARRIARTASAMGIQTVAVYSDGDAQAPFVGEADVAVPLRGRSARETYLAVDKIIEAARGAGADAIHPGYGFLSENAAFAQAVVDAGMTWVGPPPRVIEAMGDKLRAKRLMADAGVPVLDSHEVASAKDVEAIAPTLIYPMLVKASAGGGGKGMRVVDSAADLAGAVEAAGREAEAAFGDGTVFLERYLAESRHVEVQILGDSHGDVVHCFERECSIQRRHQKIVEECPSPALDESLRERMTSAATAAARAIGYENAGTVEFIVSENATGNPEFFFLEVNTRLQVEHPVTEAVTGLDLVREQLLVAQGEPLTVRQDDLRIDGHAIEVRLYAEDPAQGFLPATGTVRAWRESVDPVVRYDSGIDTGSVVGLEFDPMLAKVVAHAPTRTEAALRLALALERTRVDGVVTNRDYLVALLRSDEFLAGDTTTSFVDRVDVARTRTASRYELADAALAATIAGSYQRAAAARVLTTFPRGWRNSVMPPERVTFRRGEDEIEVAYRPTRDGGLDVSGESPARHVRILAVGDGRVDVDVGDRRIAVDVASHGRRWWVHGPGIDVELEELPRFPEPTVEVVEGGLVAPMPGKVLAVHVAAGDPVEAGQLLAVIEAMKMEHRVVAPHAGTVSEVRVATGDQVAPGDLLVVVDEPGATGG
ncbi:MAG TPA: biotin carboxylase N-terminal domain-containing protein, partial [Acidimicrobiales bacterium]